MRTLQSNTKMLLSQLALRLAHETRAGDWDQIQYAVIYMGLEHRDCFSKTRDRAPSTTRAHRGLAVGRLGLGQCGSVRYLFLKEPRAPPPHILVTVCSRPAHRSRFRTGLVDVLSWCKQCVGPTLEEKDETFSTFLVVSSSRRRSPQCHCCSPPRLCSQPTVPPCDASQFRHELRSLRGQRG